MIEQISQALTAAETEITETLNTEPYDLERLSIIMSQVTLLPAIEQLTNIDDKKALLLRFQILLDNVTTCLNDENKQLSNELEKFQLAKKGSARYYDIQKP